MASKHNTHHETCIPQSSPAGQATPDDAIHRPAPLFDLPRFGRPIAGRLRFGGGAIKFERVELRAFLSSVVARTQNR